MNPERKRVAVIGAGIAGLMAIKALKEEGCEPIVFEKSNDIIGTWKYREQDIHGMPSITCRTVTNHSKHFFLSDYLVPKDMPNYLKHSEILKYFEDYANKIDALQHVIFNREVVNIKKAPDYEKTGKWLISVKNTTDGTVEKEIFDGVLVCTGHFTYPKMAEYPGMSEFGGKIMHTHSLKNFEKFRGQKVVIVGTGCSAMDAAVAICDDAEKVHLSTRTPSWILSRVGPYGMPIDFAMFRRYTFFCMKIFSISLCSQLVQQILANAQFDHKLYGIEAKYPILSRDPIFCEGIAPKLLMGSVILRKDICYFTKEGVIFDGEDKVTQVDTVIMATGYSLNLDFLEEGTVNIENGKINLYKCMYPTHLKHPTLAIIGLLLPFGSGFPLGELQSRWAAHLLANNKELPCEEIMLKDVKERHKKNIERYCPSEKMTLRVDYIPYADEIATELGVMPNFWKMAFTDPRLFIKCIFGACIPAQYRLVGPNRWEGAREAILESSEHMQAPLSGERLKNEHFKKNTVVNIFFSIMIACLLYWVDLSLYYIMGSFFVCSMFRKKIFRKRFFLSFLLAYCCCRYGFVGIYILTVAALLHVSNSYYFSNKLFWT